MGEEGFEPTPENRTKTANLKNTGSKTDNIRERNRETGLAGNTGGQTPSTPAFPEPIDPALARVIAAWPTLPAALRAGVLAMVQAAENAAK